MSGFSAHWLAMREGADSRARSNAPVDELNHWLGVTSPVNIIDLGCGSGSNLRWLSRRITSPQSWCLLDNDSQLLARAARALHDWAGVRELPARDTDQDSLANPLQLGEGLTAQLQQMDLSVQLPALDDAQLLAASALLDLVSKEWLSALIRHAARRRIGMLFALNYDGRVRFAPAHAQDAAIRDAVNRDQYADKGFGPALGPDCVAALSAVCAEHGYRVMQWRSDWRLGPEDRAMHAQLVHDFAHIAQRQLPERLHHKIAVWQRWRHRAANTATLGIGHVDILALPSGRPSPRPVHSPAPA